MKTERMQKRLESLAATIESGHLYDLMPSDCNGNGYDIALSPRGDESGDYEVAGHLMRVSCTVKVGSCNWRDGIPAGYRLECDPVAPYKLRPGEKAEIVHRTGNNIGYMNRKLASIAIRRDGKLIYRGHTPYWIKSTSTYAAHYASGMSKRDAAAYKCEHEFLAKIVDEINTATKSRG